jgi:hypothetical protein
MHMISLIQTIFSYLGTNALLGLEILVLNHHVVVPTHYLTVFSSSTIAAPISATALFRIAKPALVSVR